MHEFSVAVALLELAQRHVPAGSRLLGVSVKAGAMRRIDPDAMQLAWQQAVLDTPAAGATLKLDLPPWTLRCTQCERQWESQELFEPCSCGCDRAFPVGGDELQLMSIEVTDP
jgi:hydrogenase nickel incorporation protein HypA/HybF